MRRGVRLNWSRPHGFRTIKAIPLDGIRSCCSRTTRQAADQLGSPAVILDLDCRIRQVVESRIAKATHHAGELRRRPAGARSCVCRIRTGLPD